MDYEKQLFEKSKMRAPKNFTSKTMEFIKAKEQEEIQKNTAKIEYSFFKLGQICVAASLLLLVLNVIPSANKIVYGLDEDTIPPKRESIFQKASEKMDELYNWFEETIDLNIFE